MIPPTFFLFKSKFPIANLQDNGNRIVYVLPEETVSFPASENLRSKITMLSGENPCTVIFDCKNLRRIDVTVVMVCHIYWVKVIKKNHVQNTIPYILPIQNNFIYFILIKSESFFYTSIFCQRKCF